MILVHSFGKGERERRRCGERGGPRLTLFMEVAMEGLPAGGSRGVESAAVAAASLEKLSIETADHEMHSTYRIPTPTASIVRPRSHYLFEGVRMTMVYRVWVAAEWRFGDADIREITEAIDEGFNVVDSGYNCYNPTSDIAAINRANVNQPVDLSKEMGMFLLGPVKHAVQWSDGLYDPTVRPLLQLWKLRVSQGEEPSDEEIQRLKRLVGFDKVKFGGNVANPQEGGVTLTKTVRGMQLDLCGIAKGLAVDHIVNRLKALGHHNVYVDWGGDIRTVGSHSSRPWLAALAYPKTIPDVVDHARQNDQSRNKPTKVTLQMGASPLSVSCAVQARHGEHPHAVNGPASPTERDVDSTTAGGGKLKGEKYAGYVRINDMSMATSGDYENVWLTYKKAGENAPPKKHVYCHIVLPTTGKCMEPGEGTVASVSVITRHCSYADGVATGALAQGDAQKSSAWLDEVIEKSDGEVVGYCIITRGMGEVITSPVFRSLMM
ncbi:hypothetical protein CBR_g37770 [Chara braunii]|uniref:FAD:protein FMN transferase n=1 Tax=Chara braunii TaxID=69332 RepID=A0A388LNQ9_CHABU|nr:hypothetical protein CBR_g37770 [Chara braunii]|eukprot:GBG83899.1 hypothetical protein CBR_g37770 [Chara braunii]